MKALPRFGMNKVYFLAFYFGLQYILSLSLAIVFYFVIFLLVCYLYNLSQLSFYSVWIAWL